MKKTYINPAINTANLRIRAILLAGSTMNLNSTPVSGSSQNIIQGEAKARVTESLSID